MTALAFKSALREASAEDRRDFLQILRGFLREAATEYADDILLALADELDLIAGRSSGVVKLALGAAASLARFAAARI